LRKTRGNAPALSAHLSPALASQRDFRPPKYKTNNKLTLRREELYSRPLTNVTGLLLLLLMAICAPEKRQPPLIANN